MPTKPPPTKPGAPYRLTYETGARSRAATSAPKEIAAPTDPRPTNPLSHKSITRIILATAGLAIITSLLFGNWATTLAVAIVCLTMLQGLWRGAAEVFGVVAAMLIAVLLAPPLGRLFEGVTHAIVGTGGLANRFLSMALVALIITISLAAVIGSLARKWLKQRPRWHAADKYAGAGLGLVEGLFIAAILFWAILTLEPIAQSQLAVGENPTAQRVVQAAKIARDSSFSAIAQSANPLPDFDLFSLVTDFAAITAHPQAREHLLQSAVVQQIQNLPSLKSAIDDVKNDPTLTGLIDDEGLSTNDVSTFMNSATILRIIDRGDAVHDLKPLAQDLRQAIHEAKELAKNPPPK